MSWVGARVRPIDWDDRSAGRTRFTADLPGEHLVGVVLRSPHPYAEIRGIDVRAARAMPGVHAVITAADFAPGARYARWPPCAPTSTKQNASGPATPAAVSACPAAAW